MQTNFNICDYIDLASLTLFIKNGYVWLLHFWVNFPQNIPKVYFKHYQNLFQDIPEYPIHKKKCDKKHEAITVLKKRGGGLARYDHDQRFNVVFFTPFLTKVFFAVLKSFGGHGQTI